jgi:coatomer protein complex subunit gamma
MNFDKKDEDSEAVFHLDKTQVFQEARVFNASPIQPKKCRILLTKIKRIYHE